MSPFKYRMPHELPLVLSFSTRHLVHWHCSKHRWKERGIYLSALLTALTEAFVCSGG